MSSFKVECNFFLSPVLRTDNVGRREILRTLPDSFQTGVLVSGYPFFNPCVLLACINLSGTWMNLLTSINSWFRLHWMLVRKKSYSFKLWKMLKTGVVCNSFHAI